MEEQVVLVVQMVRALAQTQTARGAGSSPTWHYSFLCVCLLLRKYSFIYNIIMISDSFVTAMPSTQFLKKKMAHLQKKNTHFSSKKKHLLDTKKYF